MPNINRALVVGKLMRATVLYDVKLRSEVLKVNLSVSKEKEYADKMLMLGLVHDIGCHIDVDVSNYNINGGLFLKKQGYPYWKEVYSHLSSTSQYESKELDLLNYASCHVAKDGSVVSFKKYLKELEKIKGDDSLEYQNVLCVINGLRTKGYPDEIVVKDVLDEILKEDC